MSGRRPGPMAVIVEAMQKADPRTSESTHIEDAVAILNALHADGWDVVDTRAERPLP